MDKGKEDKAKRKKVGAACIYCRRSHMTCDEGRPCKRCIKRDIGHLCHDESTGRSSHGSQSGRRSTSSTARAQPHTSEPSASNPPLSNPKISTGSTPNAASSFLSQPNDGGPTLAAKLSASPGLSLNFDAPSQNALNSINWGSNSVLGGAGFLGLGGAGLSGMDGDLTASGDAAGGNEYNILSEFLESLDGSGVPTPGVNGAPFLSSNTASGPEYDGGVPGSSVLLRTDSGAVGGGPSDNGENNQLPSSMWSSAPTVAASALATTPTSKSSSHRPSISDAALTSAVNAGLSGLSSKTEKFFLTAADQKDGTRDERLGRVIQAKYDAGLLRPYNHVNGYARLNKWMEENASQASRRRILKPLSIFRPAFRAVAQSLTNVDLIYIEEAFERLLLDYDRVFSTQGIPACLWRRTGEIYKGNKEFAELVGVGIEALRDGRCTIYELMQEESAVNYWEKYGAVSFDPGQKAVLTSCVLKTKHKIGADSVGKTIVNDNAKSTKGESFVSCCFSFTIRRDAWSIPCLIVGNFLPLQH